jgi:hypothetical protein
MKLKLVITMDNAAFEPNNGVEVARILRQLADQEEGNQLSPGDKWKLRDINGNTVGEAVIRQSRRR